MKVDIIFKPIFEDGQTFKEPLFHTKDIDCYKGEKDDTMLFITDIQFSKDYGDYVLDLNMLTKPMGYMSENLSEWHQKFAVKRIDAVKIQPCSNLFGTRIDSSNGAIVFKPDDNTKPTSDNAMCTFDISNDVIEYFERSDIKRQFSEAMDRITSTMSDELDVSITIKDELNVGIDENNRLVLRPGHRNGFITGAYILVYAIGENPEESTNEKEGEKA